MWFISNVFPASVPASLLYTTSYLPSEIAVPSRDIDGEVFFSKPSSVVTNAPVLGNKFVAFHEPLVKFLLRASDASKSKQHLHMPRCG